MPLGMWSWKLGLTNQTPAISFGPGGEFPTWQRFKRPHHHSRTTYRRESTSNSPTLPESLYLSAELQLSFSGMCTYLSHDDQSTNTCLTCLQVLYGPSSVIFASFLPLRRKKDSELESTIFLGELEDHIWRLPSVPLCSGWWRFNLGLEDLLRERPLLSDSNRPGGNLITSLYVSTESTCSSPCFCCYSYRVSYCWIFPKAWLYCNLRHKYSTVVRVVRV